jgi:hypothetical protein
MGRPTIISSKERDVGAESRSDTGRGFEHELTVKGSDSVGEPDQTGAGAVELGAADPVVADPQRQCVGGGRDLDHDAGGIRVLGRVGQRLSDEEVRIDLRRLPVAVVEGADHADRQRCPPGESPQRSDQSVSGEDFRVEACREFAQLVDRCLGLFDAVVQQVVVIHRQLLLGQLQTEDMADQSLLGTVVEIAGHLLPDGGCLLENLTGLPTVR